MRTIAIAVLVVGLAAAAVIFAMAPPEAPDEGGGPNVSSVDNSKRYQLELQRIGGKAAVAAAQFNDWFESLWHGRRLAGSVALGSIGLSLLCLLAAKLPPLDN